MLLNINVVVSMSSTPSCRLTGVAVKPRYWLNCVISNGSVMRMLASIYVHNDLTKIVRCEYVTKMF